MVDVNESVTGHIISTNIGGKNGEPKQVGCDYRIVSSQKFNEENEKKRFLIVWLV